MGFVAWTFVAFVSLATTPTCVISTAGSVHSSLNIVYAGVVFFFSCLPFAIIKGTRSPAQVGACIVCGYDMAGLPDVCDCPECGSLFDRSKSGPREPDRLNKGVFLVLVLSTCFVMVGMELFRVLTTASFAATIIPSRQALARWDNAMWLNMEELVVIVMLLIEGFVLVDRARAGRLVQAIVAAPISLVLFVGWTLAVDWHIARVIVTSPPPEHISPLLFALLLVVPIGGLWAGWGAQRWWAARSARAASVTPAPAPEDPMQTRGSSAPGAPRQAAPADRSG